MSALIPLMTFPQDVTLRRRYELSIAHASASNAGSFVNGLNADDQNLLFDIGRAELAARVSLAQQAAIDGAIPLIVMWGLPEISMREACERAARLMRQQNAFSCRKSSTKAPRPRAWTERHYRSLRREYAPVLHYWMSAYSIAGDNPTLEVLRAAVDSDLFPKMAGSAQQFVRGALGADFPLENVVLTGDRTKRCNVARLRVVAG